MGIIEAYSLYLAMPITFLCGGLQPPPSGVPNDALTLSDNSTIITLSDGSTIILAYPF